MASRQYFVAAQKRQQARLARRQIRPRVLGQPDQMAQVDELDRRPLPFLTTRQAAAYLHVGGPGAIYILIREHSLPYRRVGSLFRFDQRELDRWTIRHRQDEAESLRLIATSGVRHG